MTERRGALVFLTREQLSAVLSGGQVFVETAEGGTWHEVPPDVVVLGMDYAIDRDMLGLVLHHASYPVTCNGCVYRELRAEVRVPRSVLGPRTAPGVRAIDIGGSVVG